MLMQKLRALVLPEGLLLAAAVALVHWGAGDPRAATAVRVYPIVVVAVGALLALRFQRGRLLVALGALVLADLALRLLTPLDPKAVHAGPAVVRAVAVLLPATFAVLAFVDERGLYRAAGVRLLGLLAVPAALVIAVWIASDTYPATTARVVDFAVLPANDVAWLPMGQLASIGALLAIAMLVVRTLWRPDFESRGFLWAAVGGVIAAGAVEAGGRTTLYLANAGFVLVVAALETAYAMAYRDELTGLPARRALNQSLKQMGNSYTIAMIDVDQFKQFNDTHGHAAGDQVLRMVATCMRSIGGGRAFRYGGEEFAVLFPGKTVLESAPQLERLRESVAETAFMVRGPARPRRKPKSPGTRAGGAKRVVVTVSIGAAQSRDSHAPADVLKTADEALYRAKRRGRNRLEW